MALGGGNELSAPFHRFALNFPIDMKYEMPCHFMHPLCRVGGMTVKTLSRRCSLPHDESPLVKSLHPTAKPNASANVKLQSETPGFQSISQGGNGAGAWASSLRSSRRDRYSSFRHGSPFTISLILFTLLTVSVFFPGAKNSSAQTITLSNDAVYEANVQVGSVPGSGTTQQYTCSSGNPADCIITTNSAGAQTGCTVSSNAPAGTTCTQSQISGGPTGNAGPSVNLNVTTGQYKVSPGALVANGISAAIQGLSKGSDGGNGGDAYIFGDAGDGGAGANGGLVSVTLNGTANTTAANTPGVTALSLAGNGGNGGNAYVIGGSAGNGGPGGFGGDATAQLTGGSIYTTGSNSVGIGALSQGGNGGSGGGGGGIIYSAGGGNSAGQGGSAVVNTSAGTSIKTSGDYAYGIQARSLGGGGGGGGGGFGLFYSGGQNGSTGGNGGTVKVTANGSINTSGDYAQGVFAQSIGGGGGDAGTVTGLVALGGNGAAGGNGGLVQVTVGSTGSISTAGLGANAIEAQSIGGSGGNGASSGGLVALGGTGSSTTKGGEVDVSNSGTLTTMGGQAAGILAQSIGGGGGNGGTASGLFSFGGSGGSGADGGSVTVTNGGTISVGTNGLTSESSPGILAQSIGGGGGNGGGSLAVGPGFSAAFGGTGGAGGNGGTVTVQRDNANSALATAYSINTYGDHSSAVIAQSVGGGGGNGGFAVSVSASELFSVAIGVAGNGGGAGSGGSVTVGTKGWLNTAGANSDGILAQSIGGGGGNGGFAVSRERRFFGRCFGRHRGQWRQWRRGLGRQGFESEQYFYSRR